MTLVLWLNYAKYLPLGDWFPSLRFQAILSEFDDLWFDRTAFWIFIRFNFGFLDKRFFDAINFFDFDVFKDDIFTKPASNFNKISLSLDNVQILLKYVDFTYTHFSYDFAFKIEALKNSLPFSQSPNRHL